MCAVKEAIVAQAQRSFCIALFSSLTSNWDKDSEWYSRNPAIGPQRRRMFGASMEDGGLSDKRKSTILHSSASVQHDMSLPRING